MIIARNYLEVYPYDKWNAKEIHLYREGDTFTPVIEIVAGETNAPELLTEADLIALMDKHGIGIAETKQLYSVRGLERSELGGSHGCPGRLWD